MCTAITYATKDHYFGRNLDLEYSYHETVTVTPRNYPFSFRKTAKLSSHYAMIGVAFVVGDCPLYYDASNEKGLSMAGLNFPGNAEYKPYKEGKDNITPFEFIPWILGQCATVAEAKKLLEHINLVEINFSEELPLSPLHWMISDRETSVTVECVKEGLNIYDNPIGILTNNPPFAYQMFQLNNYMGLSPQDPVNHFSNQAKLQTYCRGMGAMGLPGDYSSASRFVKAAFTKLNSVSEESETESVSQFFHILGAVEMPRGCVVAEDGKYDITVYSSCCNVDRGIYYYKTYGNSRINGVDMYAEDLDGSAPVSYPMIAKQQITIQNAAGSENER